MADIKLMEEITNAFGPSGFEEDVCKVIKKFAPDFELTNDVMVCSILLFTSKPVHFMNDKQRADCSLDIEELAVDVGASSRAEVQEIYGILPGDPIVPDVPFEYRAVGGICFGKAFDNRLGCACIVETMNALTHDELAVDVVGAFAAQEEVGTRGAKVTAQVVKPDLAIVFEGPLQMIFIIVLVWHREL